MRIRCSLCKWLYPDYLVNNLESSKGVLASVCGPCALEIINKIHGDERDKFHGPIAEMMRQEALEWRKSHPHLGEKVY